MSGLYCKDSKHMDELADGSVHLIVTSPPYYNSINYDIHATSGEENNYRTRDKMSYKGYLADLKEHTDEWYRVLTPGGFAAVVIGTVLEKGKHRPLPFHFANLVMRKFQFHQDIIWHKVTAGIKRARVMIQHPYPGYYYPNIMTEYILVFRKDGPKIYENRKEHEWVDSKISIDDLFKKEIANNVWHIAPVPPNQISHPCSFPEEIPKRLISLYSYIGDTVLDPFNGAGTTTKMAYLMKREYVGYETIEKYHTISCQRLQEQEPGRKQIYTRYEHFDS